MKMHYMIVLSSLIAFNNSCQRISKTSALVDVLGAKSFDFGRVKPSAEPLRHTFTIRNNGSKTINVDKIRKSCTCVEIEVNPRTLLPGMEATVPMVLDRISFWGKKEAAGVIVFDDPSVPALGLHLEAFLEKEYLISCSPEQWLLLSDDAGHEVSRRTFRVREFLMYDTGADAQTHVSSLSSDLVVVDVAPWKSCGWSSRGYARESELTLELQLTKELAGRDFKRTLRFAHAPSRTAEEGPPKSEDVTLFIRRL